MASPGFFQSAKHELLLCGALVTVFAVLASQERAASGDAWDLVARLFWRTASARPPMLVVAVLFGWAGVVRCADGAGLRLSRALGEGVLPPRATLRFALGLLDAVLLCRLVPFVAKVTFGVADFGRWCLAFDLVAYAVVGLALVAPPSAAALSPAEAYAPERCAAHVRYDHHALLQTAGSRASLLRTLVDSLCAPFTPVTFWHVIVADYLTSMAKALGDAHVTGCVAARTFLGQSAARGVVWEETRGSCVQSELNAWALALPFWCRLFQCLAVLRKTGEQKNFWNACKYATAFPLVYAGYLDGIAPSEHTKKLVVVAAVAQSTATFCWDLFMDWGLFRKRRGALLCGLFEPDQMREPKSLVLRRASDARVYAAYGLLVAFNFSLRFAWALAVFGHVSTRGFGMAAFELAEIARRTVWALFRIEWEYHEKKWPLDGDLEEEEGVELLAGEEPRSSVDLAGGKLRTSP